MFRGRATATESCLACCNSPATSPSRAENKRSERLLSVCRSVTVTLVLLITIGVVCTVAAVYAYLSDFGVAKAKECPVTKCSKSVHENATLQPTNVSEFMQNEMQLSEKLSAYLLSEMNATRMQDWIAKSGTRGSEDKSIFALYQNWLQLGFDQLHLLEYNVTLPSDDTDSRTQHSVQLVTQDGKILWSANATESERPSFSAGKTVEARYVAFANLCSPADFEKVRSFAGQPVVAICQLRDLRAQIAAAAHFRVSALLLHTNCSDDNSSNKTGSLKCDRLRWQHAVHTYTFRRQPSSAIVVQLLTAQEVATLVNRLSQKDVSSGLQRGAWTLHGSRRLRLQAASKPMTRQARNLLGVLRGSAEPDRYLIVATHDSASGQAVLSELANVLAAARRTLRWTPRRTILLAAWDAGLSGLASSAEWGQQVAALLNGRALAYVSVDGLFGAKWESSVVLELLARKCTLTADLLLPSGVGHQTYFLQRFGVATIAPALQDYSSNILDSNVSMHAAEETARCAVQLVRFFTNFTVFPFAAETLQRLPWRMRQLVFAALDVSQASNPSNQSSQVQQERDALEQAFEELNKSCQSLAQEVSQVDPGDLLAVRSVHDRLLFVEHEFLVQQPLGLRCANATVGQPWTWRNVVYADSHCLLPNCLLPGLASLLQQLETVPWTAENWQLETSLLINAVRNAAASLRRPDDFFKRL